MPINPPTEQSSNQPTNQQTATRVSREVWLPIRSKTLLKPLPILSFFSLHAFHDALTLERSARGWSGRQLPLHRRHGTGRGLQQRGLRQCPRYRKACPNMGTKAESSLYKWNKNQWKQILWIWWKKRRGVDFRFFVFVRSGWLLAVRLDGLGQLLGDLC